MALTKAQKQKILEDLREKIARQKILLLVDFTGVKTKDLFDLRKKLKRAESKLLIAKKTLIKIAFQGKGIKADTKKLKGELALIFGFKDEISPAKIAHQFSQENKNFKILGGYLEDELRTPEEIGILAALPSRKELLGRMVGNIAGPMSGFVNALQGNLRSLVYILSAIKK